MKLDKMQRVMLSNQLKILEALYPDEAKFLAQKRTAIEEGYALHYKDVAEAFYDEELSEEECTFVLDVLDMYRSITFSYRHLKDEAVVPGEEFSVSEKDIRFKGFDGNNEGQYMAYCRYFVEDLGRFQELVDDHGFQDFNSHTPMIETYQNRLAKFQLLRDEFLQDDHQGRFWLSESAIKDILNIWRQS